MGRKKINAEFKRTTISISLDEAVFNDLEDLNLKSKSQLVNWLLREHFGRNKINNETMSMENNIFIENEMMEESDTANNKIIKWQEKTQI